ncbi:hypothetical protein [Arachnia propionica]|uniref:hypothetical protein n=1 Tax=Arachnia propionica TaxID=1750 RepID=UPI00163AD30F|nr:hypothetical protein [Arachnia propionica]MDO5084775.1 hypothetical protein [Arachnia propionica]
MAENKGGTGRAGLKPIAGEGRRLFDDAPTTRLRLLSASSTTNGNAILTDGSYA